MGTMSTVAILVLSATGILVMLPLWWVIQDKKDGNMQVVLASEVTSGMWLRPAGHYRFREVIIVFNDPISRDVKILLRGGTLGSIFLYRDPCAIVWVQARR